MRVVAALAVQLGIVAVVIQGVVEPSAAVAALVLAPVGYLFSYRRRAATSLAVKLALTVGLALALAMFLRAVGGIRTVDEARVPLASLFLWVQVLHAFDVPRRRDLSFSVVSSTTLVAAGGAIALTGGYVWIVVAWAGLAAAWLWLSAAPRPDEVVAPIRVRWVAHGRPHRLPATRSAVAAGLAALLVGSLLFLAMPRLPTRLVRTPPFSLGGTDPQAIPEGADSTVNPGLLPPGEGGIVDFSAERVPGVLGGDGPARPRHPVGRGGVPGARRSRGAVARGGVRHVRRAGLDTVGPRADPAHRGVGPGAPHAVRGLRRRARDPPADPDLLRQPRTSPTSCSARTASTTSTSPPAASRPIGTGRSAPRSCWRTASCTRS